MNRNKGRTNVLRKAMKRNGIPDRPCRHHGRYFSCKTVLGRSEEFYPQGGGLSSVFAATSMVVFLSYGCSLVLSQVLFFL